MVSSLARPEAAVQKEYTSADLPRLYDKYAPFSYCILHLLCRNMLVRRGSFFLQEKLEVAMIERLRFAPAHHIFDPLHSSQEGLSVFKATA